VVFGQPFEYENGTIYDRLVDAKRTFRIYAGNTCPQVKAIKANNEIANDIVHLFSRMNELQADLQSTPAIGEYPLSYVFLEPDNGPQKVLGQDECDSQGANDMHPPEDVRPAEALIKDVYESIRNSWMWDSAVLIIVFDEHGGFFDHVAPPPATPPGDYVDPGDADGNPYGFKFDRLGVRVPALIISPWTRRNSVHHCIHDHTSILATVERLFGLDPLTQRDRAARDFLDVFYQPRPRDTPARLPDPAN
jgi:phospholipase C